MPYIPQAPEEPSNGCVLRIRSRCSFAILFVSLAAVSAILSGCVTPAIYEYNASFTVHRISERSRSGVESVVTIVSPTVSSDSAQAYPDTLEYLIVNGDTAYRHRLSGQQPIFDSAVNYHIDGTVNYISLVYPNLTVLDTTYETSFSAAITAPPYGDTLYRANGVNVGYQSSAGSEKSLRCFLQITDSSTFISNDVLLGSMGTIVFPASNLAALNPGTLWTDLQVGETTTDYFITYITYYEIIVEHQVIIDRIVAYPLQ